MDQPLELHSVEEIRAFLRRRAREQAARQRRRIKAWTTAKHAIWLLLLTAAYLQFFLLDVLNQTLGLPSLQVSVPAGIATTLKHG